MSSSNRIAGGSDEVVRVEIPATLRHLNIAGACLTAICERLTPRPSPATVHALELALQEACTNVVTHAYDETQGDSRIALEFGLDANELVIDVIDAGKVFDPSLVAVPDLDTPREHGYGVFLMHELMDRVEYSRRDGCNVVRLRKALEG